MDAYGLSIQKNLKSVPGIDMDLSMGYGCSDSTIIFSGKDDVRTWLIHEGMSKKITFKDINGSKLKRSKVLYLTSDLIDNDNRKRVVKFLTRVAKESGTKIVLDINSVKNILREKEFMIQVMSQSDVIISSLDEAYLLFGENNPERILNILGNFADTIALKSSSGYYVKDKEKMFSISKTETGFHSGENFAAGLMYGYIEGFPIDKAAIIGSYLSSKEKIDENILDEIHNILIR